MLIRIKWAKISKLGCRFHSHLNNPVEKFIHPYPKSADTGSVAGGKMVRISKGFVRVTQCAAPTNFVGAHC